MRSVVAEMLARSGYDVVVASDPEQAVALCSLHEGPIDLLLTDVVMPSSSGGRLAERISELRPRINVLFMSGYPGDAIVPGIAFLQKPFSAATLARKVREVIDGGAPAVGRQRALVE